MVIRGQDYDITITLELDDGTILPPSTLEELYIYIVNIMRGSILAKYSLNAKVGYDDITVVTDPSGIVKIIFGHTDTENSPIGKFRLEIMARSSDADYEDSEQDSIITLNDTDWNIVESRIGAE